MPVAYSVNSFFDQKGSFLIKNNCVVAGIRVYDVQVAQRRLINTLALADLVPDTALDVIRKLIGVGLRHNNAHIPHQFLAAGGVFVQNVAFADKMDFQLVFAHQGIQNRGMGKAALQTVNAIYNQGNALGLLADKFDHSFKFRPLAFRG